MERKAKPGWSALWLLGAIYTPLGAGFVILGAVLSQVLPITDNLIGILFMLVGMPFLVLGATFLAVEHRKKRRMDALMEAGRFVWAEVVDCQCNSSVRINGSHPYRLIACYTAPNGVKHLFKSENLRFFGSRDLIGKPVRVYADENFKHYYVDAEPLLGNYVEH